MNGASLALAEVDRDHFSGGGSVERFERVSVKVDGGVVGLCMFSGVED